MYIKGAARLGLYYIYLLIYYYIFILLSRSFPLIPPHTFGFFVFVFL